MVRRAAAAVLVGLAVASACASSTRTGTLAPESLTWTQQHPSTSPDAPAAAPIVYDPQIGKVVLLAVRATHPNPLVPAEIGPMIAGTWTYHGTTWTKQTPRTSPPGRVGAAMAYDPAIRRVVLYGGLGFDPVSADHALALHDTWTYDGRTWTEQHPRTTPPMIYVAMTYDPDIAKMVACGPSPPRPGAETWTYDGVTWAKQSTADTPGSCSNGLTYDATLKRIVSFECVCGMYNQSAATWTYDGTNWTKQSTPTSPPPRENAPMAYDPAVGQTVLFGGDVSGYRLYYTLNDTWTYNGPNWTKQSPSVSPPLQGGGSMAYDPGGKSLVLLLGDETWTYGPVRAGRAAG